jgi:citrate lyase subunit beta / citryl-CoA lyase
VTSRARRSCLVVPATSGRFLASAALAAADEVVIDLEDSVPLEAKTDETRARVVDALSRSWSAPAVSVRVNAPGTIHCLRDLHAVIPAAHGRLASVVVPKVESAFDVHHVERLLSILEEEHGLGRELGIQAQIESAGGLVHANEIARASRRVEALVFGPGDYAASVGAPTVSIGGSENDAALYPLHQILVAARAAGVQAIDGPFGVLDDESGLRRSASRSKALGYDGKWVVHPGQIAPVNEVFDPSPAELRQAEATLSAYAEGAGRGAGSVRLDGELVDEASVRMAAGVVARARRTRPT